MNCIMLNSIKPISINVINECQGNQYQEDQYQSQHIQYHQDQCPYDHTYEVQQQHQTVHHDSQPLIRAQRVSSV